MCGGISMHAGTAQIGIFHSTLSTVFMYACMARCRLVVCSCVLWNINSEAKKMCTASCELLACAPTCTHLFAIRCLMSLVGRKACCDFALLRCLTSSYELHLAASTERLLLGCLVKGKGRWNGNVFHAMLVVCREDDVSRLLHWRRYFDGLDAVLQLGRNLCGSTV